MINKQTKNQKGFTLVEMLVAISIFVIVTLASLSIYSETIRAGQETTSLTRIQQEAQLIMQVLSKKIRTSRVDYSTYENEDININTTGDNELILIDNLGDKYIFKKSGNSLVVEVNDSGDETAIPTTDVRIDDFKFFINPTINPWSLDEPPESQPYVTIVMTVSSTKGKQTASLVVQQTIPQRSGLIKTQ